MLRSVEIKGRGCTVYLQLAHFNFSYAFYRKTQHEVDYNVYVQLHICALNVILKRINEGMKVYSFTVQHSGPNPVSSI